MTRKFFVSRNFLVWLGGKKEKELSDNVLTLISAPNKGVGGNTQSTTEEWYGSIVM